MRKNKTLISIIAFLLCGCVTDYTVMTRDPDVVYVTGRGRGTGLYRSRSTRVNLPVTSGSTHLINLTPWTAWISCGLLTLQVQCIDMSQSCY